MTVGALEVARVLEVGYVPGPAPQVGQHGHARMQRGHAIHKRDIVNNGCNVIEERVLPPLHVSKDLGEGGQLAARQELHPRMSAVRGAQCHKGQSRYMLSMRNHKIECGCHIQWRQITGASLAWDRSAQAQGVRPLAQAS